MNSHNETLDKRLAELNQRLATIRSKLADNLAAKTRIALKAADGDGKARRQFAQLEAEAVAQRNEIEILTLAIEVIKQEQVEEGRRVEEQRAVALAKRREAIIAMREREEREDIERTIERFARQGNHAQAEIWRKELSTIRQRLEAEVT